MIALFFEVVPRAGQDARYLELAAQLKPALDANGGVQFIERFRSLGAPRKLLSHQIWQDEASLARWRAHGGHYGVQTLGRTAVFEDYQLRIGPVIADAVAPGSEPRPPTHPYADPSQQAERHIAVVRTRGAAFEHPGGEVFRSVYTADNHLWLGAVSGISEGVALVRQAAG
jgi:heme-degrading monooxygenase HmoA